MEARPVWTRVGLVARAEAVRSFPAPVRSAQVRDVRVRMEPGELPRPARERGHSGAGPKIEVDMAERHVVARARRIEDDVGVQEGEGQRLEIDDPRANLDPREGRGGDRAVVTGGARVRRALLREVDVAAAR